MVGAGQFLAVLRQRRSRTRSQPGQIVEGGAPGTRGPHQNVNFVAGCGLFRVLGTHVNPRQFSDSRQEVRDGRLLFFLEGEFCKDFRMPSPPSQCPAQRMLLERVIILDLLCAKGMVYLKLFNEHVLKLLLSLSCFLRRSRLENFDLYSERLFSTNTSCFGLQTIQNIC